MSRNYSMSVFIADHATEKATAIREAAKEEWNFNDWTEVPRPGKQPQLLGWGDDRLCAGEGEEEFADRLAKAIWQANGAYCRVEAVATFLDDLPCECHTREEDDYRRLMQGQTVPDAPAPS